MATAAAVLVSAAAPVGVGAAQDSPPAVPAAYYGNVTVGGEPADPGTEIVALIDGERVGSITVDEAGQYGGSAAGDEKLFVPEDGERRIDPGAEVTFMVDGTEATTDPATVEWESGALDRVDLRIEERQTDDDTDDGGDGGAGDGGAGDGGAGDGGAGDGGAGAGGGGGGGVAGPPDETGPLGVLPPEEVADIIDVPSGVMPDRAERVETVVDEDTDVSVATFSAESLVERVRLDTSASGPVTVAEYDEVSDEFAPAPGRLVTVTQIEVPDGTETTSGTVEMRIPRERVAAMDVAPGDLQAYRWVGDEWQPVDSAVAEVGDDGPVLVEATTPGFSFFTVSATGDPSAEFGIAPERPEVGDEVTLDGSPSKTPYGEVVSWQWSVAGQSLSGETATVTLDEPGEYVVELTVKNDAGNTDTVAADLTVSEGEPETQGESGSESEPEADQDAADDPASDGSGSGPGTEPTGEERSGLGPFVVVGLVAALVVVVAAVVLIRMRSGE